MPPKKSARAAKPPAAPPSDPLDGCIIVLSGTFPGRSQSDIESNLIIALGAVTGKAINQKTTHLVTTDADFAKPSAKVGQAQVMRLHIVTLQWLEDCLAQSSKLSEDGYALGGTNGAAGPSTTNGASVASGSRKRAPSDDDDDNSQSAPKPKKKAGASATAPTLQPATASQASSSKPDVKMTIQSKVKSEDTEMNVAKSKDMTIEVDPYCPLKSHRVLIDSDGLIYDASLNQTNASNNNNKFYRIQLLQDKGGDCKVWTRWGRVGDIGQSAVLGNGSLGDAILQFNSKFKSKSGLSWADRGGAPKSGKYTFVERSYGDESDHEPEEPKVKKEEEPTPESTLAPSVQDLIELIFNQEYFAATMSALNYDSNKLPLGKLSKNTITRGYQALKDLARLINDHSLAQTEHGTTYEAATEALSNSFYSLIPHAFGRNRPPIIQNGTLLMREVDLLDSLSDMKDASNIMKRELRDAESINVLDRQFKGLNMDEMTPLKKESAEFKNLKDYLLETRGQTHSTNYQVSDIFRIERAGERERFEKSKFGVGRDTRLLWHGSRATNFGGILSQGLRIAPPEAPVSGYMFGKGIYLADMSSKSAGYCCSHISNGHALLLLCEAELGDPIQTLTSASYTAGEDAKAKGMLSTWGQGMMGPKLWKDAECVHSSLKGVKMPDTTVKPDHTAVQGACLMYNEYIAYDVAQVRLRYLFRVRM